MASATLLGLSSLLLLQEFEDPRVRLPRTAAPPRRVHDIGLEMRYLLRAHARARSDAENYRYIRQMCALFREIVRHPRLELSDRLQAYKAQLSARLRNTSRDLQRALPRRQRATLQGWSEPGVLAATDRLAAELQWMGTTLGGPAQLLSYASVSDAEQRGAGGGATADEGQQLVELIQRTISPEFWDVNGGPGTIVYYAPLRVLVVRATSEFHHRVGRLLGGVRGGR